MMDWKADHQFKECDYLARDDGKHTFGFPNKDFGTLFVLKCKFDDGFLDKEFELFDGRKKKVDDLMYHVEIIPDVAMRASLAKIARKFVSLGFVKDQDELLKQFSQLYVNQFYIKKTIININLRHLWQF